MTTSDLFVLVWREPGATRLRTYTTAQDRPIASPLRNIYPAPATLIRDADELNHWLNSEPDRDVVGIDASVAREELGWNPDDMSEETK